MKKKLFSILLCFMLSIGVLTGCDTFKKDNQAYLSQVVARAGDVVVTKEEFANGFYNYGNQLMQEGSTRKEAVKQTIEMLINRELLVNHIKTLAAKEEAKEQKDYVYELTNKEYNAAVKESWNYIDEQVKEIALKYVENPEEIFKQEENSDEPKFKPETKFEAKLELVTVSGQQIIRRKVATFENDDTKLNILNYQKPDFTSQTIIDKAWKEYIQGLRETDAQRGGYGKTQTQLLQKELKRVFEVNLDNAYLTKFQTTYENNYGYDEEGKLTQQTIQNIINYYTRVYNANVEEFNVTEAGFFGNVTSTTNRKNYFYYGEGEKVLEVQHILVKFDEDKIKAIQEDPYLTTNEKESAVAALKTTSGTIATMRDEKGFETETKMSVQELYDNVIMGLVAQADSAFTRGTEAYANFMAEEFNKLIYAYNQDEGIMNAQFDYAIGSNKYSPMVESFTDASRDLYNNGYLGAVSGIVESEYGYHIIILNNVLANIDPNIVDEKVLYGMKTSRSAVAEDNYLEYILGQLSSEEYTSYETRVLNSLKSGLKQTYYKSAYKDYLD